MFLLLPLILPVFKRHRLAVLALSALVFVVCTRIANVPGSTPDNPAMTLLLFSAQAQLFLVLGIWLGELHRAKRLIGSSFYVLMGAVFLFGLSLDAYLGFPSNGEKYPYRFDKLVNLLWTLPLLLVLLSATFAYIREWSGVPVILNVGRNSLMAFLASEVGRQFVKLAYMTSGVHPGLLGQTAIGIFDVVFVTAMLWLYQSDRVQRMLVALRGRWSAAWSLDDAEGVVDMMHRTRVLFRLLKSHYSA
jgi:OpgC protein